MLSVFIFYKFYDRHLPEEVQVRSTIFMQLTLNYWIIVICLIEFYIAIEDKHIIHFLCT